MKLSADILIERLSSYYSLEFYGFRREELSLSWPVIVTPTHTKFQADKIYICTFEDINSNSVIEKGSVIICPGPSFEITDSVICNCTVIFVLEESDLMLIFSKVQQIFQEYYEWENRILKLMSENSPLDTILEEGASMLHGYLVLWDLKVRRTASSKIDNNERSRIFIAESDTLQSRFITERTVPLEQIRRRAGFGTENYLETFSFYYHYHKSGRFIAGLSLSFGDSGHYEADKPLFVFFSLLIEQYAIKYSDFISSYLDKTKEILRTLISGETVSPGKISEAIFEVSSKESQFICLCMKPKDSSAKLPAEYVCQLMENAFLHSIAFVYEEYFILFIILSANSENLKSLDRNIVNFITPMNLCVGISNVFGDINIAKSCYFEARWALQVTFRLKNPAVCYFNDHVLEYMLENAISAEHLSLLYPEGLVRLMKHDQKYHGNFVDTLHKYLECNMNSLEASHALYVCNSTLRVKLTRIKELLQMDLNDPDVRLKLKILLKMMDMQNLIERSPDQEASS